MLTVENESLSDEFRYRYRVLDEMPGMPCPIHYFPSLEHGAGKDGVMVKLMPDTGDAWIGIFAFGDMLPSGTDEVLKGPGQNQLTVVAKGNGYIVAPDAPLKCTEVKACPVLRAVPVPHHELMIFHDYTEMVAYDQDGLAWMSKRLSWDGIEIDEVTDLHVVGRAWDAPSEQHVPFKVNLKTGEHEGGSAPPEY